MRLRRLRLGGVVGEWRAMKRTIGCCTQRILKFGAVFVAVLRFGVGAGRVCAEKMVIVDQDAGRDLADRIRWR